MTARHSQISVVLLVLDIDRAPHLVLLHHARWGDWSLVGGHIEADESPLEAAVRETEEELAPLRVEVDLRVSPLLATPLSWGPVSSRSAGVPTQYTVWFHYGAFLVEPSAALPRVSSSEIAYLPMSALTQARWPRGVTDILARLRATTDLMAIPHAWPRPLHPFDARTAVLRIAK
jgi:8-oxo-dGTP pyrophosphatase MutT (NUDIX family)